jgi:hypothetical protein
MNREQNPSLRSGQATATIAEYLPAGRQGIVAVQESASGGTDDEQKTKSRLTGRAGMTIKKFFL